MIAVQHRRVKSLVAASISQLNFDRHTYRNSTALAHCARDLLILWSGPPPKAAAGENRLANTAPLSVGNRPLLPRAIITNFIKTLQTHAELHTMSGIQRVLSLNCV